MPPSRGLQQPTRAERRRQQRADRQTKAKNEVDSARDVNSGSGISPLDQIVGGDFSQETLEHHAYYLVERATSISLMSSYI